VCLLFPEGRQQGDTVTIRRLRTPAEEAARKARLRALVHECQVCGRLNFWGTFSCGHVRGTIEECNEWMCSQIRSWPEWQKKAFREGVVPDRSRRVQ
jgi:hypothetical protein